MAGYFICVERDVAQLNDFGKHVGPLAPGAIADTQFERCDDADADHWAVYLQDGVDCELVDDFASRAAAEAWITAKVATETACAKP